MRHGDFSMLCDVCSEKEAVVHLTQVVNDEIKEIHLCEDCAAESGLDLHSQISLTDVLLGVGGKKDVDQETIDKTCPVCHMPFSDFKKTSRLGCQVCYEAFYKELETLLEAIQKDKQHVGKIPAKMPAKSSAGPGIAALKNGLDSAIASENYEEAARIRDKIKRLSDKTSHIECHDESSR